MIDEILENRFINQLARSLPRSPLQCNRPHESDAELMQLPDTPFVLALKVDSIVEEIETGLYSDPYTIGWMAVTSSISDLAAVGAKPLGILISETLPPDLDKVSLEKLQRGIADACDSYGIGVLGGDTNFSGSMQISGFAIGIISGTEPLKRTGLSPGDNLFASAPLGAGSAYAFTKLTSSGMTSEGLPFKPLARVRQGMVAREYASACMDTSDGALATLDQLMRLNKVGFRIEWRDNCLHEMALSVARAGGIPPWVMLAGLHGEFELLFTVPPQKTDSFLKASSAIGWVPIKLGTVIAEPCIELVDGDCVRLLPSGEIRNLFSEVNGDMKVYVERLLNIARST